MNLIPFDPSAPHVAWFQAWRRHVLYAKNNPGNNAGACLAAMIANAQYELEMALYKVRLRSFYK